MQASDRQVARGWGAACKVKGGEGRLSAPGMVQGRGARRWGTVVGVCLVPVVSSGVCKPESKWVRPHGVIRSRPGGLEFINNRADQMQGHEGQGTTVQSSIVGREE